MAGAPEQLGGGVRQKLFARAGRLEAVFHQGLEVFPGERLEAHLRSDAGGQRGVVLHSQARGERWEAHQPEGEQGAAVKGKVEEAAEVREESVREKLGFVKHEDRQHMLLVEEVDNCAFEVPPELSTAMGGSQTQLEGEGAVEVKRGDGGVACRRRRHPP